MLVVKKQKNSRIQPQQDQNRREYETEIRSHEVVNKHEDPELSRKVTAARDVVQGNWSANNKQPHERGPKCSVDRQSQNCFQFDVLKQRATFLSFHRGVEREAAERQN